MAEPAAIFRVTRILWSCWFVGRYAASSPEIQTVSAGTIYASEAGPSLVKWTADVPAGMEIQLTSWFGIPKIGDPIPIEQIRRSDWVQRHKVKQRTV